ncbi:glycosyltransferase [Dyadobacter tibetensis]|uniref:glycosyltransferase n=1 Tax=Dyadobacter tibetensis TaxID=1211851 RepID=UPI00046F907C|nr:glycosyltransferase [Dyadobacter tibetensis]
MNTAGAYIFKDVTLLITHYNRSQSLANLLSNLQKLNCQFEEIVVSDDGSEMAHLTLVQELQDQYHFKLITTPKNKGLGNNINKGQAAVATPLTLYIQEDFEAKTIFPSKLQTAVALMHEKPEVDLVRFYAYFEYPFLKPVRDGFYEMLFSVWKPGYRKFYVYSDHPHLRRTNFCTKFGPYREGVKGDDTEYDMMMSFLSSQGKAIFYRDFNGLFTQRNSTEEPSTMRRNYLRESQNPLVKAMRHIYRHFKFNRDYAFKYPTKKS